MNIEQQARDLLDTLERTYMTNMYKPATVEPRLVAIAAALNVAREEGREEALRAAVNLPKEWHHDHANACLDCAKLVEKGRSEADVDFDLERLKIMDASKAQGAEDLRVKIWTKACAWKVGDDGTGPYSVGWRSAMDHVIGITEPPPKPVPEWVTKAAVEINKEWHSGYPNDVHNLETWIQDAYLKYAPTERKVDAVEESSMLTKAQIIQVEEHLTRALGVNCTDCCTNPTHAAMAREKLVSNGCRVDLIGDDSVPRWYCEIIVRRDGKLFNYHAPTESEASSVVAALATGLKLEVE